MPKVDKYKIGCLVARSANDTIAVSKKTEKPKNLYSHLVYEGECTCLFSDTNIGKSIFAVQIGATIAKYGKTVLYFDFELSLSQFAQRYSDEADEENGVEAGDFEFPERFIRLEVDGGNDASPEFIIADIEQAGADLNANVLIIDNLSWLVMDSENAELANQLMKSIKQMQKMHHWTVIVIAHTPKRIESAPLSINDLAGSRQIANFFDAIFAIGRSMTEPQQRYVKQLKVRAESPKYTSGNVWVFNIEKVDHMLQFTPVGYYTEKDILMSQDEKDALLVEEAAYEMYLEGKTIKEIGEQTGLTQAKFGKVLKRKQAEQAKLESMKETQEVDDTPF